jgi:hypothetical protein
VWHQDATRPAQAAAWHQLLYRIDLIVTAGVVDASLKGSTRPARLQRTKRAPTLTARTLCKDEGIPSVNGPNARVSHLRTTIGSTQTRVD